MKKTSRITGSLMLGVAATLLPLAAFAQTTVGAAVSTTANTSVGASVTTKGGASITTLQSHGDAEIASRLSDLASLSARIGEMKNVSASDKASLQATINAETSGLTTLKASIDADTVLATLKTDVESITKDYRIYMLIIPQGRIEAVVDRTATIDADFNALAPKLEARITADNNNSVAANAYSDMQAKVSDASAQSSAALTEVASLSPDQGNTTIEASNTASLKDAAAKLKTSTADLKAARVDLTTILNAVKGTGSTSVTASSSVQ
jgi:hypothetical protein